MAANKCTSVAGHFDLIFITIIFYDVSLTNNHLNIYKSDTEKTRKISHLQFFWPTQACTIPSLIDLMLHICCCLQTQKTPASATMNMLFCATHQVSTLSSQTMHTLQTIFRSQIKSIQSRILQHATQTMSTRHKKLPMPVTKKQEQTSSPLMLPYPMFSSRMFQKQFAKCTSQSI